MKPLQKPARQCPFDTCRSNRGLAKARVVAHSRLKTRRGLTRRHRCRVCGSTFTADTGTVYARLRRPKSDFDRAAEMQSEGMTKAAIARVLHIAPSTVSRWLAKASTHARAFHSKHVQMPDPVEFQLDELACKGAGPARNAWAFSGMEVWSRLWVSLKVGTRTLRNTLLFVRQLKGVLSNLEGPVIVTTDGFKYYAPVMKRVFAGSPVAYIQVDNTYRRRGIVRSTATMVMGTPKLYELAAARSEDSKRPNTSYIERVNLHKRMSCSMLRRRTPAPARSSERLEEALELVRVIYNFVRGHSSLRFGKVKRTPAMQAGIFSRALSLREIFSWRAPQHSRERSRVGRILAECP